MPGDDGKTETSIELADILLQASSRVKVDYEKLDTMNTKVIETSLVNEKNPYRHDSDKLAQAVLRTLYADKDFRLKNGMLKQFQLYKQFREIWEDDTK